MFDQFSPGFRGCADVAALRACESSADFFVDMNRVLGKEVLGQKQVGLSMSSEAKG